jgi:uncharacterized protein
MGSLRSLMRSKERLEPLALTVPSDAELIKAIQFGTVKQVQALLGQGANPNAVNHNGDSALYHAIDRDRLRIIQILVRHGANVNHRNSAYETPLHVAWSKKRALKICSFLLDHGADPNAADLDGWRPLQAAVFHDLFDLAKLLLERGADPGLRDCNGDSALDLLRGVKGSESLRRLLKQFM